MFLSCNSIGAEGVFFLLNRGRERLLRQYFLANTRKSMTLVMRMIVEVLIQVAVPIAGRDIHTTGLANGFREMDGIWRIGVHFGTSAI